MHLRVSLENFEGGQVYQTYDQFKLNGANNVLDLGSLNSEGSAGIGAFFFVLYS